METTSQAPTVEVVGKRIMEALVEFGADPDMMQPEATLEQLEIDSLDMFELAQILHLEFGIEVNPDDFEDVRTLGDAQQVLLGYVK
jgi:acyl carrier protein